MKLKLIKTEADYQKALKRLDKIFHAKKGTKEQEELEILVMLIQRYEDETVGEFPDPDPIEAIKFKMEQMEMSQKDLAEVILKMLQSSQHWDSISGVYHFSNEGVASWYDFAHTIFELKKITVNLKPIRTKDYKTAAKRPVFSVLDKSKIKNTELMKLISFPIK